MEDVCTFTAIVHSPRTAGAIDTEVIRIVGENLSHAIAQLQDGGYEVHHIFEGVQDDLLEFE